jgi:S-adenosylmethionine/arginine decarboxylase-like enzyme
MTPFGERQVFVTSPTFRGFQMIAESHIAIHGDGLAARGEVFSCNPFDVEAACETFAVFLGGEWLAEQLVRAMTPEAVASG